MLKFIIRNIAVIENLKCTLLDALKRGETLEVRVIPYKKTRSIEQNKYMWKMLDVIANQAYFNGKRYSAEDWHLAFKRLFLPDVEGATEDTKEGYVKWSYDILDGDRVCIGSTSKLTTKGFTNYMTEVEAYATQELGVEFPLDRVVF